MTDQCPFLLRNHPSWRATTTLLRIRPTTYHPTTPVPSELGLQPLFFVQPCSVATSAAHPTRYFHPLETRGRSREECTVKGGGTVQRWSEGKTSKTRRDFCFSLWRFRQVFTPSSVSLFIDVSTSCLFARRIPSMESYPFLSEISWIFDSMDLL